MMPTAPDAMMAPAIDLKEIVRRIDWSLLDPDAPAEFIGRLPTDRKDVVWRLAQDFAVAGTASIHGYPREVLALAYLARFASSEEARHAATAGDTASRFADQVLCHLSPAKIAHEMAHFGLGDERWEMMDPVPVRNAHGNI